MARRILIGIAGGSGSGKTLVARTIVRELGSAKVVIIDQDSYYRNLDEIPFRDREARNFDHPDAFDCALLERDLRELLEGKAIEIQARKGKGPEVGFVGTRYHRGSRSIEVVWNGETILDLHETNGPALHLYRESDARAFGALYERLASQARVLFKSKAAEAK